MDEIKNSLLSDVGVPFKCVGANEALEQAVVLLGRVRAHKAEKSILITGLPGSGKTVLLNEIKLMASTEGYRSVVIEAQEEKLLAALLVPALGKILHELDQLDGTGDKVKRSLRVLKSFIGALHLQESDFDLDVEAEKGLADVGDLEIDLPALLEVVAEAALERNARIALLIDNIQFLSRIELSALIMSMHKLQQCQLPLVLIATGLPGIPRLMCNSKAYAERLFRFLTIKVCSSE